MGVMAVDDVVECARVDPWFAQEQERQAPALGHPCFDVGPWGDARLWRVGLRAVVLEAKRDHSVAPVKAACDLGEGTRAAGSHEVAETPGLDPRG